MRRRLDPFDYRSMAFATALHVALVALAWASTQYEPPVMEFVSYEIEMVSPPPARQAEEAQPAQEELVVERPEPEPTPPEPEPEPEEIVPVEEPDPEPDPPPPDDPPAEEPPEVGEETTVATTEEEPVEEEPEVSGEDLNVRMEGLRRDYPAYYDNIILQMRRCFRWSQGGTWETTVFFYIDRQGSTTDIQFVERSGNTAFDFEALGAVECAGRPDRLGPLPGDMPYDRFPVRFSFSPSGAPEFLFPSTMPGADAPDRAPDNPYDHEPEDEWTTER